MLLPELPTHATKIVLNERPTGEITSSTYRSEKVAIQTLLPRSPDEVLVRVDYTSIDPAMRGWIRDARSYVKPVEVGATMRATSVGTVVRSNNSDVKVGDVVRGFLGWTEYALTQVQFLQVLTTSDSTAQDYVDAMAGMVGETAYLGLFTIGKLKAGDTLVVSGAAGAVGSIVVQLGRIAGAEKIIAIAGGEEKCQLVKQEFGADVCLDYKKTGWEEEFKNQVGYLDVYFDNVGGKTLDLALSRLKKHARIAACGAISVYNSAGKPEGISNYSQLIMQSSTMQGFIVSDFTPKERADADAQLRIWRHEGKLKYRFHVVEGGAENAPGALQSIFKGVNSGKMIVKVSRKDPAQL